EDIVKSLLQHVPQDFRPRFKQVFQTFPYLSGVKGLREHILDTIHSDRGLRCPNGPVLKADTVDSVFHSNLPYIQAHKIQDLLQDVLSNVFSYNPVLQKKVSGVVEVVLDRMQSRTLLSAARLLELAKAIACLILEETRCFKDIHKAIVEEFRARRCLLPAPLIVADSNWVKDYFAFVVSPTTGMLEFWSVDFYGVEGRPISYWKMWVNGSRKSPQWGIFFKPFEYVARN
ncbi:MAG: hypothetical protein LLF94_01655, partial [Chlamydiales bacterium]|nr:hypothetical protein [Chlamydiales bacterium]